jgi:drug/metabolite transporter (DMT)-like permease
MLGALQPGQTSARIGILLMLASVLVFSLNDVLGKYMVAVFPVGQVVVIRSLAALAVLGPIALRSGIGPLLHPQQPWLQALRAMLMACESFCFYAAVAYLPLADTVTFWMAAPVYVAALSPFALREYVDWRGWAAILLGFAGVLLAMQPSAQSLSGPALIAFAGSVAFSLSMLLGRRLRATPDSTVIVWQMAASVVGGTLALLVGPGEWQPMSLWQLGQLALLGVVAMAANVMLNRAFKHADAATIMPFQYTILLWAAILGAVFFGDIPGPAVIAGSALIVAAGLYIALRSEKIGSAAKD